MNPPTVDDLSPLPIHGYIQADLVKNRDRWQSVAEQLRQIGVCATSPGGGQRAHQLLDEMLKDIHRASVNLKDMNLLDAGVPHPLAKRLGEQDVYTLSDLANCNPTVMMRHVDVLDVLRAFRAALLKVVRTDPE